ncbi:MAG: porin family protein [Candidatus Saccharicenans sp.]
MKKVTRGIFLTVAVLVLSSLLSSPAYSQINFGFKGGFCLSLVNSRPESFLEGYPWSSKKGLGGGIFFSLGLIKDVSFQPEILFVQKGARIVDSENDFEARFNFNYVEVPVLLKINLRLEDSEVVPSIYFGPFFGFNRTAKIVIKDSYSTETEDIKEDLEKTEYGLAFGLMLSQKWGLGNLVVDIRYDLGLSNILKPGLELAESLKTRTWLFLIGYSF